jgi:hypothetical protein
MPHLAVTRAFDLEEGSGVMQQRDMMRELLLKHGYDKHAVCAAYATAERDGLVQRSRNESGYTPEGYARAVWRDGHKHSKPWLLDFCRNRRIPVNA